MNIGPIELIFFLAIAVVSFALPIYAAIKAFQAGDNGWGIGILIGLFVPFGFVIAIAYLLQRRTA